MLTFFSEGILATGYFEFHSKEQPKEFKVNLSVKVFLHVCGFNECKMCSSQGFYFFSSLHCGVFLGECFLIQLSSVMLSGFK